MNSLRPKLSIDQEIAIWDTWQDHGVLAAEHVLMAMKEARLPAIKLKAKSPLDGAFEQAQARLRARFGDDEALQRLNRWLDEVAPMGAGVQTGGQLSDTQKPTTKSRPVDPVQAIIQGDLSGWDGR
jgi:hypothetical protein